MSLESDTPFDQYTRQKIVAGIIDSIRTQKAKFSILDVGGYKGKTQVFLPKDKVTISDIADVVEKNYVKASAMDLPFEDDSRDFVVSFDALEHVAKKDRSKFISECLRVAKRGVIICAPHITIKNEVAENRLNDLYVTLLGHSHRWLREHIDNGLPNFKELEIIAKNNKFITKSIFSNDIQLWMLMQSALFTNEKYPSKHGKLIALNRQYNKDLVMDIQVDEDNSYRQIFIALKDAKDMKKVDTFVASQNTRNQQKQKVDVIYKITDYYANLLKEVNEEHEKEKDNLTRQLDEVSQNLNRIVSSKMWRYTRKLASLKVRLVKRGSGKS